MRMVVVAALLVPACATIPSPTPAEAGLDIPTRRSDHGFNTHTKLDTCSRSLEDPHLGVFNIESVSYDTAPKWPVIYQYTGYYLYGETVPFVATEFSEEGNIIAVELFGELTTFEEMIALYPKPCDAARVVYNQTRI